MPTIPWTTPQPAAPGSTAVVMASRFEVASLADVPRFFLRSLAVWKQVRSAPGALGASLRARPLKREFCTLSAWESKDALYAFARAEPHQGIMRELAPIMKDSAFTYWEVKAAELPLAWGDADRRIAAQRAAGTASA
ncbi:DUF3291 domain-containing protein [Streptomyces sp. NPDC048057]|uniref:DUF3291 domain-containing protein n=1 Tax=Streptomyces sp. NPDC048057 TaxID=3155628 RepID=UPI00340CCBA5